MCGADSGVKVTDALSKFLGLRGNSSDMNRRDKLVQQEAKSLAKSVKFLRVPNSGLCFLSPLYHRPLPFHGSAWPGGSQDVQPQIRAQCPRKELGRGGRLETRSVDP